jgi:hypothetical protein
MKHPPDRPFNSEFSRCPDTEWQSDKGNGAPLANGLDPSAKLVDNFFVSQKVQGGTHV